MKIRLLLLAVTTLFAMGTTKASEHNLKIVYTTDVHGNFFPYNFISRQPGSGSLTRVASYVESLRNSYGKEAVVLLDNGDILQGQPSAYYFNYIDTVSTHLVSRIYDYMQYDAASIGNHDIETGHSVYDRYRKQTSTPILGANVIDTSTGKPYLPPYKIIERSGVKIVVVGMLTPAIPAWLPENLWQGLTFNDITDTARKILPEIVEKHHPDVIIGLFHSGADASTDTDGFHENASLTTAKQVPGFDAILMGHDHKVFENTVTSCDSSRVIVLNPANNARNVGLLELTITKDAKGNITHKHIEGHIIPIDSFAPQKEFLNHFSPEYKAVDTYVNQKIGQISDTVTTRDAFFGASPFMNLIHKLQLEISGADISFAAPLSFDASILKGDIHMSDMFTLYKYENMLYTMHMTGNEIKNYLEMAYDLWINRTDNKSNHLIKFASPDPDEHNNRLLNPSYNFDSAYGIDYTVDVTKPAGNRIEILSMSNGETFHPDYIYKVAVNSYRGNGGGDLLTKGAGIPHDRLKSRIIHSTDKDLRYYLMKTIEKNGTVEIDTTANWRFIPTELVAPLIEADRKILFNGSEKQK